jgi:hypothetical protein
MIDQFLKWSWVIAGWAEEMVSIVVSMYYSADQLRIVDLSAYTPHG